MLAILKSNYFFPKIKGHCISVFWRLALFPQWATGVLHAVLVAQVLPRPLLGTFCGSHSPSHTRRKERRGENVCQEEKSLDIINVIRKGERTWHSAVAFWKAQMAEVQSKLTVTLVGYGLWKRHTIVYGHHSPKVKRHFQPDVTKQEWLATQRGGSGKSENTYDFWVAKLMQNFFFQIDNGKDAFGL